MRGIMTIFEKIWRFTNWWLLIGIGLIITGFQSLESGRFYAGKYGEIYPGEYGQVFLLIGKFIGGATFLIFGIYFGLKKLKKRKGK